MDLCVFGAANDTIPKVYVTQSEELGERLALRGHGLVFGGGASGVMGAVFRGVHRRGGHILGVSPRFFDKPGVLAEACDELVFTDSMAQRKTIMEDRADGFIIAPGGIGTLDEYFQVLTLRSLGRHGKPVAVYNIAGYYDELLAFLQKLVAQTFAGAELWDCFGVFDDPETLLDYMERA